jgi:hypothetical protein
VSLALTPRLAALAPGRWVRNELWRRAKARPSLDLRFADNKSLIDAVTGQDLATFTRASSGTFVGSDGLIKTATTNLLLRSEDFNDASWTKFNSTITANAAIAPNGTLTADKLIANSGAASGRASVSITATADTPATLSCFAKQGETSVFGLFISDGITGRAADFNLVTGTVSGTPTAGMTASIQPVGDGWYRCVVTVASASLAGATRSLRIVQTVVANDGTSGLFIWGAQFEQSPTVGEYIPTTSTINSAPRFDHNPTTGESLGLLVEESRTNNLVQSEDFATTWTQSNVTVTTNTVTAPDGTTTADTFGPVVGDGLTTTRFLRQSPVLTTQQAYTFSVFVKVGTATTNGIALFVSDQTATNNFRSNFNLVTLGTTALSTGWATPTSTIIPYPNGWYRCILSGVTSTAHTALRAIIYLNFFGTTADTYGTIHIWGAQLEAGAFPTSYIPTTTATVTRSADVASITGTNFSSWYRQDEGTVFADAISVATSTTVLAMSDNTTNNRVQIETGVSTRRFRVTSSGAARYDNSVAYAFGTQGRSVGAYISSGSNHATNGVLGVDLAGSPLPVVDRLYIGANGAGAFIHNGTIRRLTYWPQRLSNSTLQAVTQ